MEDGGSLKNHTGGMATTIHTHTHTHAHAHALTHGLTLVASGEQELLKDTTSHLVIPQSVKVEFVFYKVFHDEWLSGCLRVHACQLTNGNAGFGVLWSDNKQTKIDKLFFF